MKEYYKPNTGSQNYWVFGLRIFHYSRKEKTTLQKLDVSALR
jgi:hypothetical protein